MRKILFPILAACTLQGMPILSAQTAKPDAPVKPEAPAAVDPEAQYVLGPDSQPQEGRGSC